MIFTNSIVNEMRETGRKLQEKCHNDLHLFSQMISAETEKRKKQGWKIIGKKDIESKDHLPLKYDSVGNPGARSRAGAGGVYS